MYTRGHAFNINSFPPPSLYIQVPSVVLALEYVENGELLDYVMHAGFFSETLARTIFGQLLSAMQVL